MPYLVIFVVGVAGGVYASNKGSDLIKLGLVGGAIFAAGKYAKAW